MNVKETAELIAYLKEKREEAATKKKLRETPTDHDSKLDVDEQIAKYGMEISLTNYYIRMLEGIEVTR